MIEWTEVLIRLTLASFFGAVIGLERERKNWVAGLRTHMMVCLGSCLTILVSAYGFSDVLGKSDIVLDPSRIAAQVISGIGFIGAGTILFLRQGVIRGLTTASGLWTVAAIGLATGGGMYFAAFAATVLAVVILYLIQPFEKRFSNRFKQKSFKVITSNKAKSVYIVNNVLSNNDIEVSAFLLDRADDDFIISFKFNKFNKSELTRLVNDLRLDDEIKEVTWNN